MADSKPQRERRQAPFRTAMRDHEKEDVWTDVDNWATQRLHPTDSLGYSAIEYAIKLSEEKGLPNIEVSPLQGKFLVTNCQMLNAEHVLEVGTLGGISSIWMASSSPDVKVTSIEIDSKHKAVAEEAIAHADLNDQIDVLLGAGVDVLPRIWQEIDSGKRPRFDFTFIDADKQNNLNYFNEAITMSHSRSCIIVDNVVRRGTLASDEAAKSDDGVEGARKVVEAAGKDKRLSSTALIQTVGEKNYDGFLICVVK